MSKSSGTIVYRERVVPGLWFYAATLVLPLTFSLIALPFGELLALSSAISSLMLVVLLSFVTAPRIAITADELRVGKAHISRSFLGKALAVEPSRAFVERGRELSSQAYPRFQPAVKGMVRVEIQDPNDPTPYWIFSSRNPEIVAGLLNRP